MRVGLVGAGWVTQYHLPAWKKLPGVEVVAICDPDAAALAQRADAHGIAARYSGLSQMLEAENFDAIDIASPRRFHAEHAQLAASRGVAVLCQKPLGVDLDEAQKLARVIAGQVPFMVHENWRFRPYYRQLHQWLEDGLAGDIFSVRLDFHSSGMIPDGDGLRPALVRQPFFRTERRLLVMEVLIHHLDSLRFLFGEFDLVRAKLARSNDEIIGEDQALLQLERRGDALPLVVSGNLAVHGAGPAPSDQLWIFGSKATIYLDGTVLRLLGPAPREQRFDGPTSYQAAYDGAIAHFVEHLRGDGQFETSVADNLRTLELVEAAYALSGFKPAGSI